VGEPAIKTIRWIKKDRWYSVSDCGLFYICKAIVKRKALFTAFYKYKALDSLNKHWGILLNSYDVSVCVAACEEQKARGSK